MMIGTDNKTHTDKQAAGACTPPSRAFRVHYAALFDYDGLEPAQVASGSLAVQEEQVLAELVCCGFGNARKLLSDVGFVQSTETVLSTESCLATARCRRERPYGATDSANGTTRSVRVSVARLPFCRRRARGAHPIYVPCAGKSAHTNKQKYQPTDMQRSLRST